MISSIFDALTGFISSTGWILILALLIDRLCGEPKSWHPLIFFGRWVDLCRQYCQLSLTENSARQRWAGVLAWGLAVVPAVWLLAYVCAVLPTWLENLLSVLVLYFAIGWQSLREHGLAIAKPLNATPLESADLDEARLAVSRIVSRDTQSLSADEVAKAGIESVLENGSDAIFAPIFWFLMLGAPGVLLYRLANTLDAMWGYKNENFLYFGWFAARFDDVLNYLPARLVVYSYGACGHWRTALASARRPSARWKSPNAGPVMAAGAGALGVELGGDAIYFGKTESRPTLGEGVKPQPKHLLEAISLVDKSVYLWGLVICLLL
ncbi:adenosylcobinamide-phosphate synthase CbiB [Marinomonas dokdonensis]|uniref:adenosylcobinamide-phosphate synthase CbiB n=1 Tax=Marinomonas dokdonensis TaxID=328224 RepID=UPI0040557B1F